MDKDQKEPRKT